MQGPDPTNPGSVPEGSDRPSNQPPKAGALVPVGAVLPGLGGMPPAALSSRPSVLELLKALRRRWLQAVGFGVLAAAVAGSIAYYVVPPAKYTTQSKLRVKQAPVDNVYPGTDRQTEFSTYQRTQVELIRSRFVLTAALRDGKAAQTPTLVQQADPIEWLQTNLEISYPGGAELLVIGLSSDRAEDLPVIINAVVDAYMKEIVGEEARSRRVRLLKLEELYAKYTTDMEAKRKTLKALAADVQSGNPKVQKIQEEVMAQQVHNALTSKHKVDIELTRIELELTEAQGREKTLTEEQIPAVIIDQRVDKDLDVERLNRDVTAKRDLIARTAAASSKGENDPAIAGHRQSLATAEAAVKVRRDQIRPKIEEDLRKELISSTRVQIVQLQEQYAGFERLNKVYTKNLEQARLEFEDHRGRAYDSESLRSSLLTLDALATQLDKEMHMVRADLDAAARVTLLDKAETPSAKDDKKAMRVAAMAAAAALAVVLLGFAVWEFRARRIGSTEEVVHGLGINLVGSLPDWSSRSRLRMLGGGGNDAYWQNILTESVDATRTMLLHAARTEALKVVMVTSAVGGEGKTSLSSHLAASLARAGRRTLLLDCDMRNPSAHQLFDLDLTPGLSEVLRGDVPVEEAIRTTPVSGLSLIPAGNRDMEAIQALALDEVRDLFGKLREQFDFIVVDSCPVLPVADSLLVSQHVDGVLFSIMRDVSRMPKVYAAYQRLAMLGVRMLGAVVNGAPMESYGSHYGYVNRYQA